MIITRYVSEEIFPLPNSLQSGDLKYVIAHIFELIPGMYGDQTDDSNFLFFWYR